MPRQGVGLLSLLDSPFAGDAPEHSRWTTLRGTAGAGPSPSAPPELSERFRGPSQLHHTGVV